MPALARDRELAADAGAWFNRFLAYQGDAETPLVDRAEGT